jgi:hypothetical protein
MAADYVVVPFGSRDLDRRAAYDKAVAAYQAVSGDHGVCVVYINGKNAILDEDLDGDQTYGSTDTTDAIYPNQAGHNAIATLVVTEIRNVPGRLAAPRHDLTKS